MKWIFLFLLGWGPLAVPAQLTASEPEVIVPEEAPKTIEGGIRIRIFIPPIRGILTQESTLPSFPPKVWVDTLNGPQELRLSRNSYTQSITLARAKEFSLYRIDGDGNKGELYCTATLPQDADSGVALLKPGQVTKAGSIPFTIFPLNPAHTPDGWHSFHNGLEREVELRIASQTLQIPSGERIAIKLDQGRQRVFLMEHGGKHSRRYTGAVYPQQNRGVLHVIEPQDGSTRRIKLTTLGGPNMQALESTEKEDVDE